MSSERSAELPATPPSPQERPKSQSDNQIPPDAEGLQDIPVPEQKPADAPSPAQPEIAAKEPAKSIQPDTRSDLRPIDPLPRQEIECRARLRTLGVEFKDLKPVHDAENGCSIPYPLVVATLGSGIEVAPEAEMNCQMAEASARFMAQTIAPTAKTVLNADVKSVEQASAYVCRPRHNGQKMSEHAFGNALDIASFTLTDGTRIKVEPNPAASHAKFLDAVRNAACGPFKTVLGPGSDPDHELHFHLDLEPRRNGGTFCQ